MLPLLLVLGCPKSSEPLAAPVDLDAIHGFRDLRFGETCSARSDLEPLPPTEMQREEIQRYQRPTDALAIHTVPLDYLRYICEEDALTRVETGTSERWEGKQLEDVLQQMYGKGKAGSEPSSRTREWWGRTVVVRYVFYDEGQYTSTQVTWSAIASKLD